MATDEWRMCAEWLVRCQILPEDHKANQANANAFDIAQALRDGVLICHLLNQLSPGCVELKDFSPRPQMSQFLCMKNIRTFLQTCKKTFGLQDKDLFQPLDLFDVKNFRKVIETLSKLSKTDIAISKFSGFPPDNYGEHDDEDIYGNLQDLANENELVDQEDIYDIVSPDQDDTDDIYNDIMQLQGHNRRSSERSLGLPAPTCKREHCVKELIDTEKNYVDALEMIVVHFIKKLSNSLSIQDKEIMFLNIEKLHDIHRRMYDDLYETVLSANPKIADIFIRYKSELILYGAYCSNLPIAQERIDKLCESEMYRQKIQECERQANEGKFHLRDLLSVPMQRVLKYHLLLRELIKNTDKAHPERQPLENALEAMQDLSLYVNEVKRDNEALQLIEEIQTSIVDLKMPANTSLRDYGRFQKDGELKVLSHMESKVRNRLDPKSSEKRHIFLFDKVMLMCRARSETYSFKDAIVLGEFKIDDSQPKNDNQSRSSKNWNWPFILFQKCQGTAYTFFAKTEESRQKWLDSIQMALDNTQPAAGQNFIMYTFEKPRECDVCGKLLRGIFFQGYLCQDSKKAVHKECIGKESQIKPPARPPRVGQVTVQKARARKAYTGQPPPNGHRALKFNVNDVIEILDKSNQIFWKGRFRGEEGHFLADCVDLTKTVTRKASYIDVKSSGASNGGFVMFDRQESTASHNGASTPSKALETYPWYVDAMERDIAHANLDGCQDGAFLIRKSINPARNGLLSLSIKYANAVRHIKLNENKGKFYLVENKLFDSVPKLVDYYQNTTLADSFPDVNTTLRYPYKDIASNDNPCAQTTGQRVICYARVQYDYAATSTSQVSLAAGDRIAVTSKNGNDKGWWKGKNLTSGRSGYFPLAYVIEDD
ncbi:hypothetical protein SNE40_000360 [Patella caerulea]|uniref:Guanine nucleotide exchange factor VAV2 n=1 Tax=Patella caerulea TaxID=87958 RepID=A0AAN8K505_PATCE